MRYSLGQKGFTLVELIIVIVITGILGVGIVNFIGRSTQGYADTAERQQMATIGWIVSEKISREIRQALPNSFRTNADISANSGSCLEFIPSVAGTDYVSVPVSSAQASFEVVNFANYATPGGADRIAVYPSSLTGLYDVSGALGVISGTVASIAAGSEAGTRTVNLSSAHRFLSDSPTRRLYVVQQPVMYCFEGTLLNRYSAYGYNASIPSLDDSDNPVVIGSRLGNGSFTYSPGTLSRAGIVTFSFNVTGSDGAVQPISQEVQVRNVP